MYKFFKISLRNSFAIFFGIQLILIGVVGLLIFALYQNQNNLANSRDNYFNSYILADQLRQSSDDLTRFARAYVATGDPKFEEYYWDVANIRDGKMPMPLDYNRIYWDFYAATGQKPRLDGAAISLHDLMVKQGFTSDELAKLDLAKKNSDGLIKTETIAMNAVKGLFDDGSGNFTLKKTPDFKLANDLMNNQEYYNTKAEIMRPIDDFYKMFQERTGNAVSVYLVTAYRYFIAIIVLVIIIFLFAISSFVFLRYQIVKDELSEKKLAELSSNLEKRVSERTKDLEKSEETLKKILASSEQLNKYMVGRELKMIELKKQINTLEKK